MLKQLTYLEDRNWIDNRTVSCGQLVAVGLGHPICKHIVKAYSGDYAHMCMKRRSC